MTKELSKQLCELCGIKPKIKCHPWECLHVGYYKRDKCIINFKPDEECVKRRDLSGYISYPDFGKPENFVKLLEIVCRRSSVSFCHNGSYFGCSIHYYFKDIFEANEGTVQYNFLNTLLKQDLRNPCKPKLLEQIKQTIKETQWSYD